MANVNQDDVILSHIKAATAMLFTAIPARVDSYDAETRTCSATPLIRRVFSDGLAADNESIDDIPVVFPCGGGAEITLPISQGDTVLIIFSMRNIQDWLVGNGSEVTPTLKRNHSNQDAIAIPSVFTKETARPANPDDLEILFGDSKIQITPDSKIVIESGTIELGEGGTESVVLGDSLKSYLDTHTHNFSWAGSTGSSVTSPPLVPLPASTLSDKVKVN